MNSNSFLLTYSLSYLLIGLGGLFLSVFAFLHQPSSHLKKSFAGYLLAVAWWGLFSIPMLIAPSEAWGTFWDRVCLIGLVFMPAGFIHFNFVFFQIDQKYKPFIYLNYVIGFFFLIGNCTPYLIKSTSPRYGLNYFTDPGILYYVFVVYFMLTSVIGIYNFYRGYRTSTGRKHQQLFNLFWSSLLGYSLGALNYNISFKYGPPVLAIVGNIGIFFHEVVYAYTITKHRLMDMSVVISRTVAELLTIMIHGSIYLIFVWYYINLTSDSIGFLFIAFTIMYGILVGQTHQQIRIYLQTTADKLFLKGKYNYYKLLSESSAHVGEKVNLRDILKVLHHTFHDVMEISIPRIYLPEYFTEVGMESKCYLDYSWEYAVPDPALQPVALNSDLVKEMISKREPIFDVKQLSAALIVPCMIEDRLIAFFVLGQKMSEDYYTNEDLRLLNILSNQVAIALDHARSYEKIKAELEIVERHMERSQRLASIGTLTAGVTHEIRNPLSVIRSETERLTNEPRDAAYLVQFRTLVLKHIDRISGIVERMLGLAKEKPRREVEVDINEMINSTVQLFNIGNYKVEKQLSDIPLIKANCEELQEVFVNLIQNAMDAMPQGGLLTLRTYVENGRVIFEVEDAGKGIPEEIKEKIFDPFYSTRHEGVGLGLSIVYRIIREHGGDIQVKSEVGKGTTFKIIF